MASANLREKANGTRLSRLLVDKGTEAMRQTFDNIHPPATLATVLNAKVTQLQKIRYKIINKSQWDELYPPAGNPNSKNFDITLLVILLRNICSLLNPAAGWNTMPPNVDRSVEANIVRIKLFRNEVYAHVVATEVDDAKFEYLWQEISKALIELGIPPREIDGLKKKPLSPEEEIYVQHLKDWKIKEDECNEGLDEVKRKCDGLQNVIKEIQHDVKETQSATSDVLNRTEVIETLLTKKEREKGNCDEEILFKLAKHNFKGDIRSFGKSFQEGTREWLFKRLDAWFADEESRVMILTAGPGVGKSVFAGKVCQVYEDAGKLAAYHFCKFNNSNLRNPRRMLESLASHMCDNVEGFKEKLLEQLKRPHEIQCLEDAFRILLNEPLQNLQAREPMLIVIDGLDESEADGKSDLLELIAEEFSKLPECIKILVTSRPEIPVKKKLHHLKPMEILPKDKDNETDLKQYFQRCLPSISSENTIISLLVKKCQGSFLFAFYVQSELRELTNIQDMAIEEIESFFPQGIGSVYARYCRRLERELKMLCVNINFRQFLEVLVSARGPLPLSFLSSILKLPNGSQSMKEALRKVNESLSSLLVVCDDLFTIFHKSFGDWLAARGYQVHPYAVDEKVGAKYLWEACKKEYEEIKERYPNVTLTKEMKYAVAYGWFHLRDFSTNSCLHNDYDWLVDTCIVHVMATVYPKHLRTLWESWKIILQKSSSVSISPHLQRQILCHFLLHHYTSSAFPEYLQYLINDSPSEITSDIDKNAAKRILSDSFWCEKMNSSREENEKHFLSGTLLESSISCIGISPDKKYSAVGREDGMISFLELPNLQEIGKYSTGLKSAVPCCTFSPDNSILLYGKLEYGFDVKTKKECSFFARGNHSFSDCSFSPSGTRLVTADDSETVRLWDVKTQSLLGLFRSGNQVNSCSFSQCGLYIIGKETNNFKKKFTRGSHKIANFVAIWNTITFHRIDRRHPIVSRPSEREFYKSPIYTFGTEVVISITFSSSYQDVEVYVLPQGVPVCRLGGNKYSCTYSVIKSMESTCLLKRDRDSWCVVDHYGENELAVRLFSPFDYKMRSLSVFPERCLTVCSVDDKICLVQLNDELLSFKIPSEQPKPPPKCVITCTFSPDGSRLASCTDDKILSIWDGYSRRIVQKFRLFSESLGCWWSERYFWRLHIANRKLILSWFPVNQQLKINASECHDHHVNICKAVRFFTFAEGVLVLGFKDDEVSALSITDDKLKPAVKVVTNHPMHCAAVSPDGSCILMAGPKAYEIWRIEKNDRQTRSLNYKEEECAWREVTCSITSDGELGLILTLDGYEMELYYVKCHVINMYSGTVGNCFSIKTELSYVSKCKWLRQLRICASRSFLVISDTLHSRITIVDINSGELIGRLDNPTGTRTSCRNNENIVFYRQQNILAVPNNSGYIDFIKIHAPQ